MGDRKARKERALQRKLELVRVIMKQLTKHKDINEVLLWAEKKRVANPQESHMWTSAFVAVKQVLERSVALSVADNTLNREQATEAAIKEVLGVA